MLCFSPLAYVDPVHCNMAHLFVELLKDSLNEYAYAAEIAGVNYKLENTMYGIYVSDCLSILREAESCQICCLKKPWSAAVCDGHASLLRRTVNDSLSFC